MKLEYYSESKLKKEIKEVVGRHLDLKKYKIFFFGSRVKGDSFPHADIDIGIEGPAEIPVAEKFNIEEEIDALPLLYKFDIVDFKQVPRSFKKEALKHIEYVQ